MSGFDERIEAVRAELVEYDREVFGMMAAKALHVIDHLTKTNEELRAEVELAKQEGVTETLQQIDCLTGGDGEYRLSTEADRNCPDEDAMRAKIVERFDDLRATIDRLQTTIKAFNNGMPAMTTKEVADENADLRATIDRLTREQDEAVRSAGVVDRELERQHTRLSALQETIDEAVRRADTETPFKTHVIVSDVVEPLRPFATKPDTPSARIMSDKDRENPVEGAHPMTKPEVEVDPLVEAIAELQLAAFLAGRGSIKLKADGRTRVALPGPTMDDYRQMAAKALAARGGRVVFDGREG